jgi:hypothetical protein
MTLTPAQIKATAEGTCCRWCRIPLDHDARGDWVSSGGWQQCTGRKHEPGPYIEAEAAQKTAPLDAVWIVARKSDGEAMAVYAAEADANEDVAMRHRRHRDRYKVEAWQVLGAPGKVKIENSQTNEEAFGFEPRW